MNERVWHNIRPNEMNRIPTRHVFIDTEAHREYRRGVEEQYWRCGVAIYAERTRMGVYRENSRDYGSPTNMWSDVSDFARSDGRTIVWAHNLGYDIRIASVFEVLPSLGWTLNGHNIAARGTWLEWRRDKQCIVLVDSFSVFPTSIEQIGKWFGIGKPDLPGDDADMDTWLDRCRADCRILATAVLRYLRWIKEEDLGNWQLTGNGQSWAAYRHRFMTHKLTVHAEEDVLKAERRAMWTGRCEAYWHGELSDQVIYEYDFQQAYPRISHDHAIPVKLLGNIPDRWDITKTFGSDRHAMLGEVRITTDVPVVPASHEGRIVWPVGTFTTTLWDVEIRAALEEGASVEVIGGWLYRKNPALRDWAAWVLERLNDTSGSVPDWQKGILKHWSRALIGRLAMTYQNWDHIGDMPMPGLEAGLIGTYGNPDVREYVQVGKKVWEKIGREEWQHSMPMITGYVQAIARVDLWEVLRRMPFRSVLYADTDSVFVTAEFIPDVEAVIGSVPGCGLRLKRAWDGIAIYGPRQIVTGTEVRIAGIPKRAERVGKREFEGEVWEAASTALLNGHTSSVHIRDRKWSIAGVDNRRRGTGFGFTEPIELGG